MTRFLAILALAALCFSAMPCLAASAPDGTYYVVELPCKCGGIEAYYPDSCPCFAPAMYPDLAKELDATYRLLESKAPKPAKGGIKAVGRYEDMPLECGCKLRLYVPGSSGCVGKLYPAIESQLKRLYETASKHKGKPQ